jgi:hypothetical protein
VAQHPRCHLADLRWAKLHRWEGGEASEWL